MPTVTNLLLIAAALLALVWVAWVVRAILRWKAYIWLPSTFARREHPAATDNGVEQHLIFVMVDHYEPGSGPAGVRRNDDWLAHYCPISDAHRDAYGNKFRYTWFYPYDHLNEPVLAKLSSMAYQGYGEVELHWHHPTADNETFPGMVREALAWFHRHGALVSSEPDRRSQFAFIHGNWALNNSLPICGVSREIDILFEHGCYADFTFSTIGTEAQPRKINSLYYAPGGEGKPGYDNGADVSVGKPVDDRLMIFQGPIGLRWLSGRFEYGAVEDFARPTPPRIRSWIDAHIHVAGRPEWTFVKVYSHGIQSADKVVAQWLEPMLSSLEAICHERNLKLHYMSAREAFNVAKAAEAGHSGNPEKFRDFRLPQPLNMISVGTDVEGSAPAEDRGAAICPAEPAATET